MGKKHKRDSDYQSITLREEPKVSSADWPQQSSDLFSVQARVTEMVGREIPIHDVSSAGFSERVCHSVTLKLRVDLVSLCFDISEAANLRWRIKMKQRE